MQDTFTASAADVQAFGALTEDMNPIHIDEDEAADSMFGERVVHGVYCLGWVSSMLADYGEGTTVLTGFSGITFSNPVYLDEEITVTLEESDEGILFNGYGDELKFDGCAQVIYR